MAALAGRPVCSDEAVAEAYRQLIQTHGHGQDEVARLVHKSRSHVANLLRLLNLPEAVRDALVRGDITMGHARAIATASLVKLRYS